jgi:SSS family solute:Na+ symporter/sodium/proline symporter
VFASIISSYNVVIGLTFAYLFGPWVVVVYLGALFAFIGIYFLAKGQNREVVIGKKFNSIIDYFAHRFGELNASTLNLLMMLVLFIFISLQFFINTAVFSNILGWDKYTSSLVVGIIVLLYTFIGGLKIEIFTDVFQGILMLFIVGLVFIVDTSQITMATITPLLTDKIIIIGAISLAAAQFLTLLVQPEMWQRVYAAKSIKDVKKGFVASWVLLFVIIIPQIIVGIAARASGGIDNPGNLFYDILRTSAPGWFLPFLSVALFAAFMSSLDSSLFALSSQLGKYGFWIKSKENIYQKRDQTVVKNTRVSIVVVTILAVVTSLYFSSFLVHVLQLVSLLTVISAVVLLSLLFKVTTKETFLGTIVAAAAFIYAAFSGLISEVPHTTLYPSIVVILFMLGQNLAIRIYKYSNKTVS